MCSLIMATLMNAVIAGEVYSEASGRLGVPYRAHSYGLPRHRLCFAGKILLKRICYLGLLMDRAYCISLERDVSIDEAIGLYARGDISRKDDFACLDPGCRADYICINLGNPTFKVSPYFRTAENAKRKHVDGCSFAIEERNDTDLVVGPVRRPRLAINDDVEILFMNARPKGYFYVLRPYLGGGVINGGKLRYIPSGHSSSNSGASNPKCYSIERILNGGWGVGRKIVLDGVSDTIRNMVRPVDAYRPDSGGRYIYCGLAKCSGVEEGFCVFKFGRSFLFGVDVVDVYLKLSQSAIDLLVKPRSIYYKELAGRIMGAARNIERYPNNPLFIYALGLPVFDVESNSYVISVDNIDHFYIESRCGCPMLVASEYSDWEKNMHYFSD